MTKYQLTARQIQAFGRQLRLEEKSPATQEKYLHDVKSFYLWLRDGRCPKS